MRAAEKLGDTKNSEYITPLRKLLKDPVPEVRGKTVAAIVSIGTQHSLEPLAEASRDSIPEIQFMAVDGMVNFYYPGYVKRGFSASLKKFGSGVKNRFAQPAEIVIDPYVPVSPNVIGAIARLITGGVTLESRANAARAAGILRGQGSPSAAQGGAALQGQHSDRRVGQEHRKNRRHQRRARPDFSVA